MSKISRAVAVWVAVSVNFAGGVQIAQAVPISTEQVAVSQGVVTDSAARARLLSALERADVAAALAERGVSLSQARARVAALTDAEAVEVAEKIDQSPAGAGDFVTAIVLVFVLLLITDVLGFTKVFSFTRPVR